MTVNGFTQLGLVEMTRKRTRESLAHVRANRVRCARARRTQNRADRVLPGAARAPARSNVSSRRANSASSRRSR